MARMVDGDKIVEALSLIAKCWSVSPFVSKEKHLGAVSMLREVERKVKEAPALTQPNEPLTLEVLRKMEGEPFYDCASREWYIVDFVSGSKLYTDEGVYFDFCEEETEGRFYRRPPEGEEETVT